VIALVDATGPFFESRHDAFAGATDDDWAAARRIDPDAFGADGSWQLAFRCFALRGADGRVTMVDAGVGPSGSPVATWAPVPGDLPAVLPAVGIAFEFSPFRGLADGRPIGDRADDDPLLRRAVEQLTAYFARELREFDLPLAPAAARSSDRSGTSCAGSPGARPRRTERSRTGSATPTPRPAPSGSPTAATRSRS
jgi:hypothetical protein